MAPEDLRPIGLSTESSFDLDFDGTFNLTGSPLELDEGSITFDDNKLSGDGFTYFFANFHCICGSLEARRCSCTSRRSSLNPDSSSWIAEDITMSQLTVIHSDTTQNGKKERRRQQNRAAQERYRDKQQKVLVEAKRRIDLLRTELERVQAEKEQYKGMYEDVENQLSKLVGLMKQQRL